MSGLLASADEQTSNNGLVMFGVAESDAHVVANKLIEYELRLVGYSVVRLGACTPIDEFADGFRANPHADLVVIGSLNGHACEDSKGLQDARRDLLITCSVIVGDNLDVTSEKTARTRQALLSLGMDHVPDNASELPSVLRSLPRRNSLSHAGKEDDVMRALKIAIVGATGAVGTELIKLLEDSNIPVSRLRLIASSRSAGRQIKFRGTSWPVGVIQDASDVAYDIAFFSAGGAISLEWAPQFAAKGALVIDNSNAFRMDSEVPLIVSQVNPKMLVSRPNRGIVANPNCSTIQLVRALRPLAQEFSIRQIVLTTYQAASGGGLKGINELLMGAKGVLAGTGQPTSDRFPVPLAFNVIPQVGELSFDGMTLEELKLTQESRKILSVPGLKLTATCVRVPVINGHSEAVYVEFSECVPLSNARELLAREPGIQFYDETSCRAYPTPRLLENHGDVHVGRIRANPDDSRGLWMWVVANNLQVGAALNAVQIAELAIANHLIGEQ